MLRRKPYVSHMFVFFSATNLRGRSVNCHQMLYVLALPYGGMASAGPMYPPQRWDLIHVGSMRQSHRRGNELGGVVCARLVWLNPVFARQRVMCKVMWAGAGYVSKLTDIFIKHRTEPSSPNLPASNHTLGLTVVDRLRPCLVTLHLCKPACWRTQIARPIQANWASSQGDVGPSLQVGGALTMALP